VINGYSEPGASPNTLANADNAKILIELNGASAGPGADGLRVAGASSLIEGLVINRFSLNGIDLQGGGDNIQGNFVGTNPTGNTAEPNQLDGIRISNSSGSVIGGSLTPASRNVVSGNGIDGILIVGSTGSPATDNVIQGNFVGVNAAGTGSVGIKLTGGAAGTPGGNDLFGIEISGGNNNGVGGTTVTERNVIGFNAVGIGLDNGSQGNFVGGNFVGVGSDAVTPVGNNLEGIAIHSSGNLAQPLGPGQANEPATSRNVIGLDPSSNFSGLGNTIAFNGTAGVDVFGNPLPNNAAPVQNSGNSVLGNSIFQNGRSSTTTPLLGIDLTNSFAFPREDGFTANDSKGHGLASDPNNFQNSPVLTAVTQVSGGVQITGSLTQSVSPHVQYRIEFFANNPDPKGLPAEGQTLMGAITVTTDASGSVSFAPTFNVSLTAGQIVTATATNLTADPSAQVGAVTKFNTSEFSPGVVFTPPAAPAPPTPTPTPTPTVSVAFPARGSEVLAVVTPSGALFLSDATGLHQLAAGGIASASVTFGPFGQVLDVVTAGGALIQVDGTGLHQLAGSGIASAGVGFGPAGEVMELVTTGGALFQLDAGGLHQLTASGVVSASIAFGPGGQVLEVITQDDTLVQVDAGGVHTLLTGIVSASAGFSAGGEVLDLITQDDTLAQIDGAGVHNLGKLS
jgi:hypothetical protein